VRLVGRARAVCSKQGVRGPRRRHSGQVTSPEVAGRVGGLVPATEVQHQTIQGTSLAAACCAPAWGEGHSCHRVCCRRDHRTPTRAHQHRRFALESELRREGLPEAEAAKILGELEKRESDFTRLQVCWMRRAEILAGWRFGDESF
jgi:hypothetical protein